MANSMDRDLVEQLKQDYARFPENQTYHLYAEDVQFKDPMNEFQGVERYQQMINFLARFFNHITMDLHAIDATKDDRVGDNHREEAGDELSHPTMIKTEWTLHMNAPLPWSPRLSIPGRSELGLNQEGLINSHIDYWHCSRFAVLMQVFGWSKA